MKRKIIALIGLLVLSGVSVYAQRHFETVWTGNGYMHMNLYVFEAEINGVELDEGDEIAVFDGEYCVGVAYLEGPIDRYVVVTTSMNDPFTQQTDGFTRDNPIEFRIWDNQNEIEFSNEDILVTYVQGNDFFSPNDVSVVNLAIEYDIPQNVSITLYENEVTIGWSGVRGAVSYRVYSAEHPLYGQFELDTTGNFDGTTWRAPLPGSSKRFYYVTSVFED